MRELLLRDLGGLVYEIHRTGSRHPDGQQHGRLVTAKVEHLAVVDAELHELEARLGEPRGELMLREPGLGGACSACGEIYGSDARFCSHCGMPLPGNPYARPIPAQLEAPSRLPSGEPVPATGQVGPTGAAPPPPQPPTPAPAPAKPPAAQSPPVQYPRAPAAGDGQRAPGEAPTPAEPAKPTARSDQETSELSVPGRAREQRRGDRKQTDAGKPSSSARSRPADAAMTARAGQPGRDEPSGQGNANRGDAKQADAKSAGPKATDAKPTDAKPTDAKPTDAKPADAQPTDAKAAETKPADAKQTEVKSTDPPDATGSERGRAAGGDQAPDPPKDGRPAAGQDASSEAPTVVQPAERGPAASSAPGPAGTPASGVRRSPRGHGRFVDYAPPEISSGDPLQGRGKDARP